MTSFEWKPPKSEILMILFEAHPVPFPYCHSTCLVHIYQFDLN